MLITDEPWDNVIATFLGKSSEGRLWLVNPVGNALTGRLTYKEMQPEFSYNKMKNSDFSKAQGLIKRALPHQRFRFVFVVSLNVQNQLKGTPQQDSLVESWVSLT